MPDVLNHILVTGGAGFIGSHTVDLLLSKGYKVRVLDNLEKQVHRGKKPDYLNEDAEYLFGDIRNISFWNKALKGIDAVIHLAAMVGVGQSMYQPKRYLTTNTIGTANFFEVLLKQEKIRKNIKKIVVASSKSIYGEGAYYCKKDGIVYPPTRPKSQLKRGDWEVHCPVCGRHVVPVGITEDKPVQNLSIYALSKYDTERTTLALASVLNIPAVAMRYFNVYGPRQSISNPYTGVLAIFLSRIKNNNPPIIFEDGKQMRDFIYVEDVARANLLAVEKEVEGAYNIGTGQPTSLINIISMLSEKLDTNVEPNITHEFREGDNRHDFANISKAQKELGFRPKVDINKGLSKLVEWVETQEAEDMFFKAEQERKRYFHQ